MHRQSWAKSRKTGKLNSINLSDYAQIVFFTGAGMSAESGIPTYQGEGGVWEKYNFEEYACESAFKKDPEKVLKFHEIRRQNIDVCKPHIGHDIISNLQKIHTSVTIITQNIDGMHQKSGSEKVIELHGSLWQLRCTDEGTVIEDSPAKYISYTCQCGAYLRPNIVWFGDKLNNKIVDKAYEKVSQADLFISIGTSGGVWPAADIPHYAKENGSRMIEINPAKSIASYLYNEQIRTLSSEALLDLFKNA